MKKFALVASLLATISTTLTSCGEKELGHLVDPDGEIRLVTKDDYIVDFSVGDSDKFTYAHGYSNGGSFADCIWDRNSAKIEDGVLTLSVQERDGKYYGSEYRAKRNEFHYGYFATKMKAAKCTGVISSFFGYTNNPVWDEIDFEFMGKDTTEIQFNHYCGGKGNHEYVYQLGFDASEEFHEYGFDWQKDKIAWYIDGVKIYETDKQIPSHPLQIMMNVWNCIKLDEWSGKFNPEELPAIAQYQYIAYIPAK